MNDRPHYTTWPQCPKCQRYLWYDKPENHTPNCTGNSNDYCARFGCGKVKLAGCPEGMCDRHSERVDWGVG